ncbi:MAG: DUF2167 domain-containing protein [Parachlamydiaceae bacterium]
MKKILLTLMCLAFDLLADISFEELEKVCAEFAWKFESQHRLPLSRAIIDVPQKHVLLVGKDAQCFRSNVDAIDVDNHIEAILFSEDEPYDSVIMKSYNEEGYIPSDDWKMIDPKLLMTSIRRDTNDDNKKRRDYGGWDGIEIKGWLQEPTRDPVSNTIFWAIEAVQGGESIVNAVALKLSRHGYEQFIWVTSRPYYTSLGGELDIALKSFSFPYGERYEDYSIGDKTANYGIAGLVTTLTGARVAFGVGGIFLLLKQYFGIALAIGIGIAYACRFLVTKRAVHHA